jgi:hypothetical protein
VKQERFGSIKQKGGIQPEPDAAVKKSKMSILEREIQTGPGHPKIVVATFNQNVAPIGRDTNPMSDANFQATTQLADEPGVAIIDMRHIRISITGAFNKRGMFASAEDYTTACKYIRRESGAMDREPQGKGSQDSTDEPRVMFAVAGGKERFRL